jgi:hypothetical protein
MRWEIHDADDEKGYDVNVTIRAATSEDQDGSTSARNANRQKKSKNTNVKKPRRGLDIPGVKVAGNRSSCMQDAVLNGAGRLGVDLCKDVLYRAVKPRKLKGTSLGEIEAAECVDCVLRFKYVPQMHQLKGGVAYNLLQILDDGVFLVTAESNGKQDIPHAFVYDSGFRDEEHPEGHGAIIDNRQGKGSIRLILPEDRSHVKKVYPQLSKKPVLPAIHEFWEYFGRPSGGFKIEEIYRMVPKTCGPVAKKQRVTLPQPGDFLFAECPLCVKGSGKPLGHSGRHLETARG